MLRRQIIYAQPHGAETMLQIGPRTATAGLLTIAVLLDVGFREPLMGAGMHAAIKATLLALLWAQYLLAFVQREDRKTWLRSRFGEIASLGLVTLTTFPNPAAGLVFLLILDVVLVLQIYLRLVQLAISYNLLLIGSFAILSLLGTALLLMPAATPPDSPIRPIDALFTATSATCVTGLVVRDTPTEFTRFGHVVILVLMQLGGLGIVIFGSLLATMIAGAMSVRHAASLQEVVTGATGVGNVERLVRFIILATLSIEAVGALLFYVGWSTHPTGAAMEMGTRLFHSIFYAVSGFCNAGFATIDDSMVAFRYHWSAHFVLAALITFGGLGFPALFNLWQTFMARLRLWLKRETPRRLYREGLVRLTIHTKVVLITSLVLYLIGLVGIIVGQTMHPPQFDVPPETLTFTHVALDAHFMSISGRTAGFNTVFMEELSVASQYVLMLVMWIGGSPGGTAGGVKTTVVAILFLTILATLRNREETEVFKRSIPDTLVRRSGAVVMLGFAAVAATTLLLTLTQPTEFTVQLFEAVSACATVGLSMGLTPELTDGGRLLITLMMFLGRLGPLVLLGAFVFQRAEAQRYRYPPEPVIIG